MPVRQCAAQGELDAEEGDMSVALSAQELRYGGGPLSADEMELSLLLAPKPTRSIWGLAINGCRPANSVTAKSRRAAAILANEERVLRAIRKIGMASNTELSFDIGDMFPNTIARVCIRLKEKGMVRRIDGLPTRWEAL